ncbi:MAG: hypothetical protein ACPIOQ_56395, partial [Promethearchaeia archaeon]
SEDASAWAGGKREQQEGAFMLRRQKTSVALISWTAKKKFDSNKQTTRALRGRGAPRNESRRPPSTHCPPKND